MRVFPVELPPSCPGYNIRVKSNEFPLVREILPEHVGKIVMLFQDYSHEWQKTFPVFVEMVISKENGERLAIFNNLSIAKRMNLSKKTNAIKIFMKEEGSSRKKNV